MCVCVCVCVCVFGEGERRRREKYRVVKPKVDKWRKIDIWPSLSAEVAVWKGLFSNFEKRQTLSFLGMMSSYVTIVVNWKCV